MPPAAELRPLIAQYGSPARDDWLPWVVAPVPEPIAVGVCAQMLLDATLQLPCEDTIRSAANSTRPP